MNDEMHGAVVGLALGSGSARGWSHIGVLQEMEAIGVRPQVIAGTSVGALVGALYVSGQLDAFAEWLTSLSVRDVFGLLDFTLTGGMVKGEKLFGHIDSHYQNPDVESLEQRFISVATDMKTGREHWISSGPVIAAARASCALPGVFRPVLNNDRWMLDGGLVNPVPVSACRACGAEVVIAVNLNAQLVGAHWSKASREVAHEEADTRAVAGEAEADAQDRGFWQKVMGYFESGEGQPPGFFDVISASINIMQDRITRSRMAGDPPEMTLIPHLEDFAMMDFHRAEEAIKEGRRLVQERADEIRAWAGV